MAITPRRVWPRIQAHIAGKDNIVADALSRMEANFNKALKEEDMDAAAQVCACAITELEQDESVDVPDPKDAMQMKSVRLQNISQTDSPQPSIPCVLPSIW